MKTETIGNYIVYISDFKTDQKMEKILISKGEGGQATVIQNPDKWEFNV